MPIVIKSKRNNFCQICGRLFLGFEHGQKIINEETDHVKTMVLSVRDSKCGSRVKEHELEDGEHTTRVLFFISIGKHK